MRLHILFLAALGCSPADTPRERTPDPTQPTGTPAGTPTGTTIPWMPDFEARVLIEDPTDRVRVGNLRQHDLGWGPGTELLMTLPGSGELSWVSCDQGGCVEVPVEIPPGLVPVRSAIGDMDADGQTDIVLSTIGELGPSNATTASLWVLYGEVDGLTPVQLAGTWPRTVCAEPADLDADGDLDLTICQFGHTTVGSLGWLENLDGSWMHHVLYDMPGAIHAFPVDLDGDGDLDIISGLAQKTEEVVVAWNDGAGNFTVEPIFEAGIDTFGLAGIEVVDLDQDGDLDVVVANGDTLDSDLLEGVDPNDQYGVHWLENDGSGDFTTHYIHGVWGAYATRSVDMDGDDDLDIVLVNYLNQRTVPGWPLPASVQILENDGSQGFDVVHDLEGGAPQSLTLEVFDFDGDDDLDILTSSMNTDANQGADTLVVLENRSPPR